MTAVQSEIVRAVGDLSADRQQQVLDYARALSTPPLPPTPRGRPGRELLRFRGSIPPEDLQEMAEAIRERCEKVNPDGW